MDNKEIEERMNKIEKEQQKLDFQQKRPNRKNLMAIGVLVIAAASVGSLILVLKEMVWN